MGIGADCKLYYNTGTYASPTWVEIVEARDVTVSMSANKVEQSDRSSKFNKYESGLIDLSISFNITYRNGNTNFGVLQAAFFNRTVTEFAAMDGAIATAGNEGLRFFGSVFNHSKNEPLNDGQTFDFELSPSYHEEASSVVNPEWFVAS